MASAATMTVVKPEEVLQGLQENLPPAKQKKYTLLKQFMADHPDLIGIDPRGQVVIRGRALPGTQFKDIVKSMFSLNRKDRAPEGLHTVLAELRRAGLSGEAISSNAARGVFFDTSPEAIPDASVSKRDVDKKAAASSGSSGLATTPSGAPPSRAHTPTSHHRLAIRLNDSHQRQRTQSGKGDLMKFLPGRPVKMLRLY
jgi:hypothetical protein